MLASFLVPPSLRISSAVLMWRSSTVWALTAGEIGAALSAGKVCCWSDAVARHLNEGGIRRLEVEVDSLLVVAHLDDSNPNFEDACLKDILTRKERMEDRGWVVVVVKMKEVLLLLSFWLGRKLNLDFVKLFSLKKSKMLRDRWKCQFSNLCWDKSLRIWFWLLWLSLALAATLFLCPLVKWLRDSLHAP